MPTAVLHWVVTPLVIVLVVLLRLWGNRVIRRRQLREAEEERSREAGAPGRKPKR